MPGFTTHYIMGMKVFNDLPPNYLKHIIAKYRWLYQLGLQGPDMFFYNIPILRHRDYRNVGSYMHEAHVNDFFNQCFSKLSQIQSKQQREQGLSYLCGFICHYVGDSICHPFVYGRIQYNPKQPDSRCHGLHAALENDIDAILLYKYKQKKPSQFNQAATICLNGQEIQFISHFLKDCINQAYYPLSDTNHYQVSARMIHRSILALRFGCRTLSDPSGRKSSSIEFFESIFLLSDTNHYQVSARMIHRSILALRFGCRTLSDPSGRKSSSIEFFESIFLRQPVASQKLVTDNISDVRQSLNSSHEPWANPWNPKLVSTESFPDLFRRSIDRCGHIYLSINRALATGALFDEPDFENILEELGNYSYHSGLDAEETSKYSR